MISINRNLLFLVLLTVFTLNVSAQQAKQSEKYDLPDEYLTLRVNPAVFKILTYLDFEYNCPEKFTLKKQGSTTVLEEDYQKMLNAGSVSPSYKKNDFYWEELAKNPEKYIETSGYKTRIFEDGGSGTGFFVSREGILLTNAHVVEKPGPGLLGEALDNSLLTIVTSISSEINSGPPPYVDNLLLSNLTGWISGKCSTNNRVEGIYLVLDYLVQGSSQSAKSLLIPLTILAEGKSIATSGGGKDVAVLKIKDSFEYVCASGEKINLRSSDFYDKFITTRLGDSDDVLEGMDIDIFGFPAGSFLSDIMSIKSDLRASSDEGKIGPIRESHGGWKIFEMSAKSRPGDSGGPVVAKDGEVIAVSAARATTNDKSSYAIPINIAKEFLKEAGITPDPGPLTNIWEKGLYEFSLGQYDNSEITLFNLKRKQLGNLHTVDKAGVSCKINWVNPYVKDIYNRAYTKARKGTKDTLTAEYDKHILKGTNYSDQGKHDLAVSEFSKAININPKDAYAYHLKGISNAFNRKYVDAILDFSKSIRLDPDSSFIVQNYTNRAGAYYRINFLENAIYSSNMAIKLDENHANAYLIRGHSYTQKKRYQKAIDDYNQALKLDPDAGYVIDDLEFAIKMKKENELKIDELNSELKTDPSNPELFYNRCTYNLREGTEEKFRKAVEDCTRAIELEPNYMQAYNNRGMGNMELGNYQLAESDFKKAIEIDPDYAVAYESLGEVYIKTGRYEVAKTNFNKALNKNPDLNAPNDYLELIYVIQSNETVNKNSTKENSGNEISIQDLIKELE